MLLVRAALPLWLGIAVASGCGDDPPTRPPLRDAGRPDAERDAGVDARIDARQDGDAGTEDDSDAALPETGPCGFDEAEVFDLSVDPVAEPRVIAVAPEPEGFAVVWSDQTLGPTPNIMASYVPSSGVPEPALRIVETTATARAPALRR